MDMLPVDRLAAERLTLGGDEVTVLTTSRESGGAIFAVELRMRPGGGPPVLHRHEPSEIYYVISGEFTFYVGEPTRQFTAKAGDVVPLTGGIPHTIRNESDEDAVVFQVHSPGTEMEAFVRAGAALGAGATMDEVLAVAERHGVTMLGSVPAT